ncbi:MAG: CDP-alcohol phosphatidyltransferase family protein [Ruminococcaceae bacterium]|nr:CDP-alcohol phosphatidyltransferase family protein [Oscillospiraceae bacterium]
MGGKNMHKLFKKNQILTIPNLLSLIRLLMIPVIIWLYCEKEDYLAAAIMTVLSGLTDIADGIIARKFHLVSDLGKILDPIADKLTQAALIFCLISKFEWMLWLFIFFAVKEITMGISGMIVIKKKDVVNSSQWFGKLATVVLYAVMILLFLFPGISTAWANVMILLCAAVLLLSMVKYLTFHCKLLRSKEK